MPDRDRGKYAVIAMGAVVVTMAILGGLVYWGGSEPAQRHEEGVLAPIAFALPLAAPALLALLGWRDRPWLLVAAGLALVPMTMLSFSYIFILLFPSACVFFGVAITRPRLPVHARTQPLAALLCVLFVLGAVVNFVAGTEQHTVASGSSTVTVSGAEMPETSTWIGEAMPAHRALTTIAFVAAAVAIGAFAPKDRRRVDLTRTTPRT